MGLNRTTHRPEWHIQQELIEFLKCRQWNVEHTHGNAFQTGFPDLYVAHKKWGQRWIDCKVRGRYTFTKAQRRKWPLWDAYGIGIWILTAASQSEYDKLFRSPNWREFWKPQWSVEPDIDAMLEELRRTDQA